MIPTLQTVLDKRGPARDYLGAHYLWVASQDFRNDVVLSEGRMYKASETYRLLNLFGEIFEIKIINTLTLGADLFVL